MGHFLIETRPRSLVLLGLGCLLFGGAVMAAMIFGLITAAQLRPFRVVVGTVLGVGIASLGFGAVRALLGVARPREDG